MQEFLYMIAVFFAVYAIAFIIVLLAGTTRSTIRAISESLDENNRICSQDNHDDHSYEELEKLFSTNSNMYWSKKEKKAYLKSPAWKKLRNKVREREQYCCEGCGAMEEDSSESFEIHHNTYQDLGCESLDQLHLLCRFCHQSAHDAAAAKYPHNPYGREHQYPLSLIGR